MKSILSCLFILCLASPFFLGCFNSSNDNPEPTSIGDSSIVTNNPNVVDSAVPYTIRFVEITYAAQVDPLPAVQSYVASMSKDGLILVIGGRTQGLHTFKSYPDTNFLPKKSNHFMILFDPLTGKSIQFDVNTLPANLSAPLQASNQQMYHDHETDLVYIVGGYGWKADGSDMETFNTLTAFKMEEMVTALKNNPTPEKISKLFVQSVDDRFAVTGGEFSKMDGKFYLVFGQKFTGQYRAFGGNFGQFYTEEVRVFTFAPNTLKILSYGTIPTILADRPFHRRDGNTIHDIDPSTGKERIGAYGGVFKPGIIGSYDYPVFINNHYTAITDTSIHQKFSQYECPVISIFDSSRSNPTIYHVFFGGIGSHYYWQTPKQKAAYDNVTLQHRNDGFPFVADISHFQQSADGSYKEFIYPIAIPQNRLLGSTAKFIGIRSLYKKGLTYANGVFKLPKMPSGNVPGLLIGYIYGGVEAQNPLPLVPNSGTVVTNSVFAVYLTKYPAAAIPASFAHKSIPDSANIKRE